MKPVTLITMIVVLTTVWGGFVTALFLAVRKESAERAARQPKRDPES